MDRKDERSRKIEGKDTSEEDLMKETESRPDFNDCEWDMENECVGIRLGSSSVPKAHRPPEPAPNHGDTDEETYEDPEGDGNKYFTEAKVEERQRKALALGTTGTQVCEKETDGDTEEEPNEFFSKAEIDNMIDEAFADDPEVRDREPTVTEASFCEEVHNDDSNAWDCDPLGSADYTSTETSLSEDFKSKILRGTPRAEASSIDSSTDDYYWDCENVEATPCAEVTAAESWSDDFESKILRGTPRAEASTTDSSSDVYSDSEIVDATPTPDKRSTVSSDGLDPMVLEATACTEVTDAKYSLDDDCEPRIVEVKPRTVIHTTDGLACSEYYVTESSSENWEAEILGGTAPTPDYTPYESEEEEFFNAQTGLPPAVAVKNSESLENFGLSDWSDDDDLPLNVAYDKDSGTLTCGDAWVANISETLHLACLTFPIRKDGFPTLLRVDRPVLFGKMWRPKHDIYVGCINVTNVSKHCLAYKVVPVDEMKLIPEDPCGFVEYGQSKCIVVYTSMDVPYTFYDIKNEGIKLLAAPVVIFGKKGLTLDGWDKVEDKHVSSFWNFYKTDWLPYAEILEVDGFQPEENKYGLETGYTEN